MTLNALAEIMNNGARQNATLIANTLAHGKSRQVCIDAFKTAYPADPADPAGAAFGSHKVVVAGENRNIRLRVSVSKKIKYLIEFKIWMAVDILDPNKLMDTNPEHGIYGAYKADYDKLVAAREQVGPNGNGPLTASCTLIYFLAPAAGPGAVPIYQDQVAAGLDWQANNPSRCQVSSAAGEFIGMIAAQQRIRELARVHSTSIVSKLLVSKPCAIVDAQGNPVPVAQQSQVTLAAVWTEVR
jgi:hypothetical protein